MGNGDEPLWPAIDPDEPRQRRRRRAPAVAALALALALAVLAALTAGATATTASRTIDGRALPASTAARTTTTTTTAPTPTSTTPPLRRIYRLADHPLLVNGAALPPATCQLPPFRRDKASLHAYYVAYVECMDRTWQPVLTERGMPHTPPAINTSEHPGETGCGNPDDGEVGEFTAMYCPADQTLYLPVDRLKDVDGGVATSHLAVVAHEYVHHVQELSGLMGAFAAETDKVGEKTEKGNELSRRLELQVNCFAGLFLAAAQGHGTIGPSVAKRAVDEFRNGGLPQTHGSRANQAAWAQRGYQQRTTAACNTFAAPPREVS